MGSTNSTSRIARPSSTRVKRSVPSLVVRTLTAVDGNRQRLDGGAMFGNVPKALWERWIAPDAANRIALACRAMLIEETYPNGRVRRILCEAGIGAFFDPKMRARYGIDEPEHVLLANLAALEVTPEQIDVIVLSHLHFDHAGGLLTAWSADTAPALAFPRASYVVGKAAWERASQPHARDRASFIPALQRIVEATGRLEVVDDAVEGGVSDTLGTGYRLHRSDGHTPGLVLLEVPSADGAVVFAADLIPGRPWIHLPVTMGYDRAPELLIDEKLALLEDLVGRNGRLFFTHDPDVALCRVVRTPRGDFAAGEEWAAPKRMPL